MSRRKVFEYAAVIFCGLTGFLFANSNYPMLLMVNRGGQSIIHNQLACAYTEKAKTERKNIHELNCKALVEFKKAFELNPMDQDVSHNLYLILQVTRGPNSCKDIS